jgi:hypothetical protein
MSGPLLKHLRLSCIPSWCRLTNRVKDMMEDARKPLSVSLEILVLQAASIRASFNVQ